MSELSNTRPEQAVPKDETFPEWSQRTQSGEELTALPEVDAETDDSHLETPAKFAALATRLGIEDDQSKPLTDEQIKKIAGAIDSDEDFGLLQSQLGSRNQIQFGLVGEGEDEKFEMIPRDNKIEQQIKAQLDRAEARIAKTEATEAAPKAEATEVTEPGEAATAPEVVEVAEPVADSGLESKRPFSQAESDAAAERLFATYGVDGAKPVTEQPVADKSVEAPKPAEAEVPVSPVETAPAPTPKVELTSDEATAANGKAERLGELMSTGTPAERAAARATLEQDVREAIANQAEARTDEEKAEAAKAVEKLKFYDAKVVEAIQNRLLTGKENFNGTGSNADRAAVGRTETEAWSQDREARKLLDVQKYWDERIAGTKDIREKLAMEATRNNDVEAERNRFKTISQDTLDSAAVILENARVGRFNVDQLVKGEGETPKMLEDKALARREVLGLEPVPFLEIKTGGLFHRKNKRGPKVIESYFKVPGLENVVVVERRLRNNGELLSQNTYTTKEPIRKRRTFWSVTGLGEKAILPPIEMRGVIREQRVADRDELTQDKDGLFMGRRPREYVSGFRTKTRFQGLYGSGYGATPRQQNKFDGSAKRGGFWFGLFGGF